MAEVVPRNRIFQSVPAYFRRCCEDAAHDRVPNGYFHPGHELVRHIGQHCPDSCPTEHWKIERDALSELVGARQHTAVLGWFAGHFPLCMAMVPRRRRDTFLAGVYQAAEKFGISVN